MVLTVGSLFSGVGGLELGLERTGGFKTIWQSEIDEYASAILRTHWQGIPNLGDITKIDWNAIRTYANPDVICGGFPCQDISSAGKGLGIKEGVRSGLWKEYAKAIRFLRPKYAVIENVPMLLNRGMDVVLCDLAEIGYDAEWKIISAESVGAPHQRKRVFILAYPNGYGLQGGFGQDGIKKQVPDGDFEKLSSYKQKGVDVEFWRKDFLSPPKGFGVDDGVSYWMDRDKCLGNAVVPQVAQVIGYRILELENYGRN